MDRIQHPSATSSHQFTEGDPGSGVPATTVTATWLNGLQEELVHLIEAAGIVPSASILTQVKAALDALYSGDTEVEALAAEVTNRQNADMALANSITAALTALQNSLTALQNSLTTETSARTTADTNLSGMISAETTARTSAMTTETATRVVADLALDTSLGLQQIYTRVFSNGLMDFFPLAVPDDPTDILAQSRIVHHKNAAGKTVYAELFFHWSATFLGSSSAGWTIPDSSDALGADIDAALREVWGIGPSDEWKFPYLHGTLQCAAKLYTVVIYYQSRGAVYSIIGWDQAANRLPFGDLRFLIPGENL